eukprot:CAMPEP_0197026190 /NCGR_PEP_ID=MMETSP1384-20130603/6342_1 /TAXON_ID=29189 /ORGANISM="Ammonia sp." /LENGTH=666 /DNA_ID=CAMNT_0042454819 /DNA_START=48 /DNA_END=2048 /DNA_ORIENTATION=-
MDSSAKINRKKRIITDLQRLREPPQPNLAKYDIRQDKANDLDVIYTEIRGPPDSFYEGGYFVLRFQFTNDYPVSSPSVAFATKIWHPNVDHESGSVCLNSLNQNWQPTVNLRHILDTHMPWLLKNGNPDDPLNSEAGQQMKVKDPKYANTVKTWVKRHANQSQLHLYGSVWYKDQPKKKKKKKKFSIAELTASVTPTIKPINSDANNSNNNNAVSKDTEPTIKTRLPSKSMGHIEYNGNTNKNDSANNSNGAAATATAGTGGGAVGNDENASKPGVDAYDFQDWWSGSKILPNTPSKSGKPEIRRSHSFCVRPDSSPWMNKRPAMRRNTTEPFMDDHDDEYVDYDMNMKLISLYDDHAHDNDEHHDSNQPASNHNHHRIAFHENVIIPSSKSRKTRKKKHSKTKTKSKSKSKKSRQRASTNGDSTTHTNTNTSSLEHSNGHPTRTALMDGDSELSSMDEEPTYDLDQYKSLTSLDLSSLHSKYSQHATSQHHHAHPHTPYNKTSSVSQTPSYNYSYASSTSSKSAPSNSKSYDYLYSRSAGFLPQMDHFMCPEFSPLSPAKPTYYMNSNHVATERMAHFSPNLHAQKVNTSMKTTLFLNDSNDIDYNEDDEDDDDDDDVPPSPHKLSAKNLKINTKFNRDVHGDVDMSEASNILIQTADQSKMSLD